MEWRHTRVLVTGHTGFKGPWLTLWLARLGCSVTGLALPPPTSPALFDLAGVGDCCDSLIGDVRDARVIADALARARPEVVFHLAAQSLVRESYRTPVDTFAVNVMGTVNLLEAVRHTQGVRAVVIVTSDKCYENREWPWPYRECDALGGYDPYSASKAAAELVTSSYARSFFTSEASRGTAVVATARAGNVIGGGDWTPDGLVADIARAFGAGQAVHLRNPSAVRPWQHVLDALNGYLTLAARLCDDGHAHAGAWNFGPGDADMRPVSWVADQMVRRWGPPAAWAHDAGPAPHEAGQLRLDSSKARATLGWAPKLDLPTALDWTVDWYRAYHTGESMQRVTVEQIDRYLAL